MIDEFQRLGNLHVGGNADPMLVSLFETPMSFRKTSYFITGNQAEIHEIPITSSLTRIDLRPLRLEDDTLMFSSLLAAYDIKINAIPHALLNHLGGNPFYIKCVARAIGSNKKVGEEDCWRAYIKDISSGNIHLYWSSLLKSFFSGLGLRKNRKWAGKN